MEIKCLFETRRASFCSENAFRLTKRSDCWRNIDDQLKRWHLSQHNYIGFVQEHELILSRSGLPLDLASEQLEQLWICEKHRHDMGKNWRTRRTCQYPLHSGWKKELKTRNAVNMVMSSRLTKLDSRATFCDKYSIVTSEPSFLVNQTSNYPNQKLRKKSWSEGSNILKKSHHSDHWNTAEGLPKWSNAESGIRKSIVVVWFKALCFKGNKHFIKSKIRLWKCCLMISSMS